MADFQDCAQSALDDEAVLTGFVLFVTYMDSEGIDRHLTIVPEGQTNTKTLGLAATLEEEARMAVRRDIRG